MFFLEVGNRLQKDFKQLHLRLPCFHPLKKKKSAEELCLSHVSSTEIQRGSCMLLLPSASRRCLGWLLEMLL